MEGLRTSRKEEQTKPWKKNHQDLLTKRSLPSSGKIPGRAQSTAATIPSPFLCPFLAAVTTGQQAGWMLDFAHCKCSSPLWTSKVKIVRDLWLDSSVFQMGKAFNCFQPGARAVPVTMKWKALHPVLTSHSSLVLSSLPCLAFAFFIL